ncbi:MAG: DNA recombination protein RmuC [Bacteroidales bacterium]
MSELIYSLLLAAAVIVAAWLFIQVRLRSYVSQARHNQLEQEYATCQQELAREQERSYLWQDTAQRVEKELKQKQEQLEAARQDLAAVQTDLHHQKQLLASANEQWQKNREQHDAEFQTLANRILEDKSKRFTEQNKVQIDALLTPLHERIKEFEKRIEEGRRYESEQRISLREEVRQLATLNKKVSEEANNLVRALKGDTKKQGNWGEMILEKILEHSGLRRGYEYHIQAAHTDMQGNRRQPDVVIDYPGNRQVVIDAKVNLVAYERFISSEDKHQRAKALDEHVAALKRHIQELSNKRYQDLYNLATLDFVMLFVPIEPAYMTALGHDEKLWEYAYERKILLISPTNLMASLKLIATMWQQEHQKHHVQEIARQSGALYDKFVGLVEDLQEVGVKFQAVEKAYQGALNKLSSGKGNLVSRVERIRELGAKSKKELPGELVTKSRENLSEEDLHEEGLTP